MHDDTLISFGGAVKALGNGRVGGYLVRFSGANDPDLVGEYFTKSTDFWLSDETDPTRRVIYHHGFDRTMDLRKLGRARLKADNVGLWAEAQLDLRDEYERKIEQMAKDGKLGWSSGSAPHLVRTKRVGPAKEILSWPITEVTLTPTPAEPRATVVPLKSLKSVKELSEGSTDQPDAELKAFAPGAHVKHKDGGCGEVKSVHVEGEHPVATKCMTATKDAPIAYVDMHDADHKCTGAVKCYPAKDLESMDDGAVIALKAYEPDAAVPPDARVMIALEIAPETAKALALPGGEPAQSLHLTLCYIGRALEVGTNAIERLKAVCRDVTSDSPPLFGKIAGVGRFSASDTSDGLDVIYASADVPNLAEFRQRLADYLQGAGIAYRRAHGFTPHVTLSYIDPAADSPVKRIDPLPLAFEQLCLSIEGEKTYFPFGGGNSPYGSPVAYRSVPAGESSPETGREFSHHSQKVVSAVGGFVERAQARLGARVKAGRELSAANRTEIEGVCTALESGVGTLRAILDRTAPEATAATPGEGQKAVDPTAVLRLRAEALKFDHFLTECPHS